MNNPSRTVPSAATDQEQFLTVLSREEALARFEQALFPRDLLRETRKLDDALGCALAADVVAPIDVPPGSDTHNAELKRRYWSVFDSDTFQDRLKQMRW